MMSASGEKEVANANPLGAVSSSEAEVADGIELTVLPDSFSRSSETKREGGAGVSANPLYSVPGLREQQNRVLAWVPSLGVHEIGAGSLMAAFIIFTLVMSERMWKNA